LGAGTSGAGETLSGGDCLGFKIGRALDTLSQRGLENIAEIAINIYAATEQFPVPVDLRLFP
jgi:hypothetical protein